MRCLILGAALTAISISSATAATKPHKRSAPRDLITSPAHRDVIASAPDMSSFFAIFDKLFPPQPDPDPAKLALAQTTAAALWPNGAYGNLMTGMLGNMFDNVMKLKESDLPDPIKVKKQAAAGAPDLSVHDQAVAKDPYFDQRAAAIRQVVVEELAQISAIIDPRIRTGFARSMARRFDARQLADINAFFATPSGRALAGQYMQMWVDPDTMRSMFTSVPEMMKLMPDMMRKVKAAAEKYPMPPKAPKSSPTQHHKS